MLRHWRATALPPPGGCVRQLTWSRRGQSPLYARLVSSSPSTGDSAASGQGNAAAPPAQQLTGTVKSWSFMERRGTVVVEETGEEYVIANARAFETVLPTMLRTLEGAKVTFRPANSPAADRVIIRSRVEEINAQSYKRDAPIDFAYTYGRPMGTDTARQAEDAARATGATGGNTLRRPGGLFKPRGTAAAPPQEPARLYAKDIVVDLSSMTADKLARISGPLVAEEPVKPTTNLKDMRSSRIFDQETNEYLQLRRQLNSGEAARAELERRHAEARKSAVVRHVVARDVRGVVVAWSAIHRSGVILEGVTEVAADAVVDTSTLKNASIIRNVFSFSSALPTSHSLLHRPVTFTKVTYSQSADKSFAEDIVVAGDLSYDASPSTVTDSRRRQDEEEKAKQKRERLHSVATARDSGLDQAQRILAGVEDTELSAGPQPEGPQYGVITRWSGGQGTVESGTGRVYYIQSAAAFQQLVDRESRSVRGAVVSFTVSKERPRFATEVSILSLPASSVEEVRPLLDRVTSKTLTQPAGAHAEQRGRTSPALMVEKNEMTGKVVLRSVELEPEGVDWIDGTLVSWSPVEDQGIISGSDGERYVLRDADENAIRYADRKALFKKGRKVKFTAYGTSGRLACNVVALDTEADEEELRAEELRPKEPRLSLDGNVDEAIASPLSTDYWLKRMTKVGFDVSDVKQRQNRALSMNDLNDDDDDDDEEESAPGSSIGSSRKPGKTKDTVDILKEDEWWRDPSKNRKLPGSDMRLGDFSLISPAAMLNNAMRLQNPKSADKMLKKYQSKMTEDQKAEAWRRAKDMAPKYEEQVKLARERNEEPTFYFF